MTRRMQSMFPPRSFPILTLTHSHTLAHSLTHTPIVQRTILEFCILQLQQKRLQCNQAVEELLGPEATFPLRPWALIFTKNKAALEQALRAMSQDMKADGSRWEDRRWLEGIRIW